MYRSLEFAGDETEFQRISDVKNNYKRDLTVGYEPSSTFMWRKLSCVGVAMEYRFFCAQYYNIVHKISVFNLENIPCGRRNGEAGKLLSYNTLLSQMEF